jgi:hypothetical protein
VSPPYSLIVKKRRKLWRHSGNVWARMYKFRDRCRALDGLRYQSSLSRERTATSRKLKRTDSYSLPNSNRLDFRGYQAPAKGTRKSRAITVLLPGCFMSTVRVSRNKWTLKLSAQRVTAVRSPNIALTGKTVRDSELAHWCQLETNKVAENWLVIGARLHYNTAVFETRNKDIITTIC